MVRGMKTGYTLAPTYKRNLDLQLAVLRAAGCSETFEDAGISGTAHARPGLARALELLGQEDALVVWKLACLGLSLGHLVGLGALR